MKKRLSGITTKTGNNIFRKYELQNENSDHFSRLNKIILKNGAGGSLKPTTFNWAFLPSLSQSVYTPTVNGTFKDQYPSYPDPSYTVCTSADYDGNGLADFLMSCSAWGNTWKFAINNGDGQPELMNYGYNCYSAGNPKP